MPSDGGGGASYPIILGTLLTGLSVSRRPPSSISGPTNAVQRIRKDHSDRSSHVICSCPQHVNRDIETGAGGTNLEEEV